MSASEHLNGEQLSFFLPAHVLMTFHAGDSSSEAALDQYNEDYGLMEKKRRENMHHIKGYQMNKDVKKHGVKTPVTVIKRKTYPENTIFQGHHRIIAAYDANPNMEVPVEWYVDY
jgi:hypothetical protein